MAEVSLLERVLSGSYDGAAAADPAILDAARDLFCRLGIQRTTMDDVARRAGLSRITVYRRVASKEALIEQVVVREFGAYFAQFLVDIQGATTLADRVVVGFVSSLKAFRTNPLVLGLLDDDDRAIGVTLLGDAGATHEVVRRFVAGQLRREQSAGHLSASVDVDLVAEVIVRLTTSFLLTPSKIVDVEDDDQLATIARQFLVPLLEPRRSRRSR